jgi:hypothetical protein
VLENPGGATCGAVLPAAIKNSMQLNAKKLK